MSKKTSVVTLMTATILLQSFSFLSIKYATLADGILSVIYLAIAFIFIIGRSILWQIVLKLISLSKAYPFSSLVQVLIFAYAVFLFNESVASNHFIGLFIMLLGLMFISKSS